MQELTSRQIQQALAQPFAPEDLEWRLQQAYEDKMRGMAVPYVTNRAIQNRLDEVCGPENWYNDFKPWHSNGKKESQLCGIAIHFEGRGWITKWDGAEDSDIEPVKGGLSDSMKRAAYQWGIGRVLYKMNPIWVGIEQKGSSYVIKDSERARLNNAYLDTLKKLNLQPAQPGGLQPQLTPRQITTPTTQTQQAPVPVPQQRSPQQNTHQNPQHRQQSQQSAPQPVQNAPVPFPGRPVMEYRVLNAQRQQGMDGQISARLVLEGTDGKKLNAFAQGAHPALVPGAELFNVNLSMHRQDAVVFHVLNAYTVIPPNYQAA